MGGVDRAKPAILASYIQDREWETFCDDIDAALKPVARALKFIWLAFGVSFLSFIVTGIVIFSSFGSGFSGGHHNGGFNFDDDFFNRGRRTSSSPMIIITPFVIMGPVMGLVFLSFINVAWKSSKANEEMGRVCKEISDRQPRLSFHVRYERFYYNNYHNNFGNEHSDSHHGSSNYRTDQYIEVSVNENPDVEAPAPYAEPELSWRPVPVMPTAPYAETAVAVSASTKDRLNDLEKARHLLTAEEYDRKRADILSSI